MGATGSVTTKASIKNDFLAFTKWDMDEVSGMFERSQKQLSETFALRKYEFDFLLGGHLKPDDDPEKLDWRTLKRLYHDMFARFHTRKGICDKFEVVCGVILVTSIPSEAKLKLFFDLFNFNSKGYLMASELKLLIISVTNGANKMDPALKRPTLDMIDALVQSALTEFATVDPGRAIRRPELISFAQNTREILAFMDAWRGHASQVMTGGNRMWEDPFFLAEHSSIVPSRDWLLAGLPPRSFIYWRRLSTVNLRDEEGNPAGCTTLFGHTKVYFREVTKNPVYSGTGCAARGYLKQGLLADRYILNAISVCVARPEIITSVFATTEQEHLGRYNIRLFEGAGWRSIYVDDRVPCLDDTSPAFMSSSDPSEAWPMLLEKAIAKYFGSYGHLALSSSRFDSVLAVLKMLTGGHVIRKCTSEFQWISGRSTVISLDGCRTIRLCLGEGSLVAFGRSEVRSLDRTVPLPEKDEDEKCFRSLPPLGRLFPVVGIIEPDTTNSYVTLVLRDGWDTIAHDDGSAEPENSSGHFRTFNVRLDDIPWMFDYMVLCRFPDALRAEPTIKKKKRNKPPPRAIKEEIEPWRTLVESMSTESPFYPARFRLIVKPSNAPPTLEKKTTTKEAGDSNNPSGVAGNTGAVVGRAGIGTGAAAQTAGDSTGETKHSEPHGGQEGSATVEVTGETKTAPESPTRKPPPAEEPQPEPEPVEEEQNMFGMSDKIPGEDETAVDIAMTISTAFDWIIAGDDTVGAETRVRVVPTGATLVAMRKRRAYLKERERVLREKRAAVKRMLEAEPDQLDAMHDKQQGQGIEQQKKSELENELQGQDSKSVAAATTASTAGSASVVTDTPSKPGIDSPIPGASDVASAISEAKSGPGTVAGSATALSVVAEADAGLDDDEPEPIFDEREVYTYASAGSWLSLDNLRLLPGEYLIYADVSYSAPIDDLQSTVKRGPEEDFTDCPWKAGLEYCVPVVWVQASTADGTISLTKLTTDEIGELEAYLEIPRPEPEPVPTLQSQPLPQPLPENASESAVGAESTAAADTTTPAAAESGESTSEKPTAANESSVNDAGAAATASVDGAEDEEGKRIRFGADSFLSDALPDDVTFDELDLFKLPMDLEDIEVGPATWPFMAETQKEAATRGLYERLTTLRTEAEQLAGEFLSAAKKTRDLKKKMHTHEPLRVLGAN